jgi:post-segregation antitoxin (ccd killing protein)
MPKVSVYLPDELYRSARDHGLPISTLAQRAIEAALQSQATDGWVSRVRARSRRHFVEIDSAATIAEAREEFGT